MLYREIIAVCSQIHTEHINTWCGQNVELLNVKLVVQALKAQHSHTREVSVFEEPAFVTRTSGRHLRTSRTVNVLSHAVMMTNVASRLVQPPCYFLNVPYI